MRIRALALLTLSLVLAGCSSAGRSRPPALTPAGLRDFLALPGDLPPYLYPGGDQPSLAEQVLTKYYPGAVGASLLLVTDVPGAEGYVTVVVFTDDSTAENAILTWQSLLHVFGNVVEVQLPLVSLGEEAYGAFLRPTYCAAPPKDCFVPQIRLLVRRASAVLALAYPIVFTDPVSTYPWTLEHILHHCRRLDSRLLTSKH